MCESVLIAVRTSKDGMSDRQHCKLKLKHEGQALFFLFTLSS